MFKKLHGLFLGRLNYYPHMHAALNYLLQHSVKWCGQPSIANAYLQAKEGLISVISSCHSLKFNAAVSAYRL